MRKIWFVTILCFILTVSLYAKPETNKSKVQAIMDMQMINVPANNNVTFPIESGRDNLSESFEGTFPPEGWTRYAIGASTYNWSQNSSYYRTGTKSAAHVYDGSNYCDGWLVTPRLTVGPNDSLIFYDYNLWPTWYFYHGIWVSTTGGTPPTGWTQLVQIPVGTTSWTRRAVNLSAYNGQNIYLAFVYRGLDADNWYIDDVSGPALFAPTNDLATTQILRPYANEYPLTSITPSAKIKNVGTATQNNFYVSCKITDTLTNTVVYHESTLVTSLASNVEITITFSPNWNAPAGVYWVAVKTLLAGDENPNNNEKVILTKVSDILSYDDGTAETYFWVGSPSTINHRFAVKYISPITAPYRVELAQIYCYQSSGLAFTSVSLCPDSAGIPKISSPIVSQSNVTTPTSAAWIDVPLSATINDNNPIWLVVQWPAGSYDGPYIGADGSAPIDGYSYWSNTAPPGAPWNNWTSHDWMMRLQIGLITNNDVGVMSIVTPLANHVANTPMTPSAIVKNLGTLAQSNIPVYCQIVAGGFVRYSDGETIPSLASGAQTTVNFASWLPTIAEVETVKIWTALTGDENPANDLKTKVCDVYILTDAAVTAITRPYASKETEKKRVEFTPQVTVANNGSFSADVPVIAEIYSIALNEGFESTTFPPAGWDTSWIRGTSTSNYWCLAPNTSSYPSNVTPHSGSYMAEYNSFSATAGNAYRLRTPWINLVGNNVLSFWMFRDDGYLTYYDSIMVMITTNGTDYTELATYTRPDPTGDYWEEKVIPLTGYSGNVRIAFDAYSRYGNDMFIDDVKVFRQLYRDSTNVTVSNGASAEAYFTPYASMTEGTYLFKAYTKLAGDMNNANNEMTRMFSVTPITLTLVSPSNEATIGDNTPKLVWNKVPGATAYQVQLWDIVSDISIDQTVSDTTFDVTTILPDNQYYWKVRVVEPTPEDPWSAIWSFTVATVAPGWTQKEDVPQQDDIKPGKFVKDGGCLIAVGTDVYALPGNKSNRFYKYGETGWDTTLPMIPMSLKYKPGTPLDSTKWNNKKVGKGAAMCFDGDNTIYATKGNGTHEFFAYNLNTNTWTQKAYVPTSKGLKGGTQLAFLDGDTGFVFLLAGGQKATDHNFYRYNTITNTWDTAVIRMPLFFNKPHGEKTLMALTMYPLPDKRENPVFILITSAKGVFKYYLVLYFANGDVEVVGPFDAITNPPSGGGKWGDIKTGGGITRGDGGNVYFIPGGGKQDFWRMTPNPTDTSFTFTPLETIPRLNKKSVPKAGAALTAGPGRVWLMKGNNTQEFWVYGLGGKGVARPMASTITSTMTENNNKVYTFAISVTPNPVSRTAVINYSLPMSTKASLKLYNSSGQLVETLVDNMLNAGSYTLTLNATTLAKGVYFLKYEANGDKSEVKLIVQ